MEVVFLLIIGFVSVTIAEVSPPSVTTPLGRIEGFIDQSVTGRPYNAFEGVPYARPPVGKYRFKEPIPPKPWPGVWQAKTMFKCMQYFHYTPPGQDMVTGDEDCLYINVYSPNLNPRKKMDVLVYIHGGAFMFSYAGFYGPKILMDRDIVYVNVNYRLGPLGFLSTEDDVVPGNNGLKDQMMALKWIKENIEYFGGNPNSVTITGMSAGGASIEFQYILPKSQGLFHKGISQSGVVLNSWVLVENALEKTKSLSTSVGCPVHDTKQMVDCLRHKPGRQITHAVKQFQPWLYNPYSPFGPVVDSWASDPLIPDHPYKFLKNKQVQDLPWMISYVDAEGLYPGSDFYMDDNLQYIDEHWNEVMPYILHYNEVVDPKSMDSISQKIRKEYLQDRKVTKETFSTLIKLIGDRLFVADIEKAARLHAAAVDSPVYSYYFNYRGAHSKSELRTGPGIDIGVSHGDDTSFVFHTIIDVLSTENDRLMSKMMVDMFVSFMRTGTPNITSEWKPVSKVVTKPWYQLQIKSPHELIFEEKSEIGNRKFWDSLPLQENENLFNIKEEL